MPADKWDQNARAASLGEQRVVEQRLDPDSSKGKSKSKSETFSLYYFTKDLTASEADLGCRTILFMTGGPGEIALPGQENFGDLDGYRIVYFHLRGAGFSQVPSSNSYDKYLRTRFAVEDIECIREDLGIKKWRGIIGHSYGAVLAQQYAAKHPEVVWKLVLSAPFSRHEENSPDPENEIKSLERIYRFESFKFLEKVGEATKQYLCDEVKKITQRAEDYFGNVQLIIEVYDTLDKKVLKSERLGYSLEFFRSLRRLRHTGWLPIDEDLFKGSPINVDTAQSYLGLVIAKELLGDGDFDSELGKSLSQDGEDASAKAATLLKDAFEYFAPAPSRNSQRAYYVFSVYDGLSKKVMAQKKSDGEITQDDIESIGGKLHVQNPFLSKVGLNRESVKAWDPKQYVVHDIPTLVLKGGADTVSEGGQVEYIFNESLRGPRMLLDFPGVGHSMTLPPLVDSEAFGSRHARDCLLREFLDKDFAEFAKSRIHKAIQDAFTSVKENPKANIHEDLIVKALCADKDLPAAPCESYQARIVP